MIGRQKIRREKVETVPTFHGSEVTVNKTYDEVQNRFGRKGFVFAKAYIFQLANFFARGANKNSAAT